MKISEREYAFLVHSLITLELEKADLSKAFCNTFINGVNPSKKEELHDITGKLPMSPSRIFMGGIMLCPANKGESTFITSQSSKRLCESSAAFFRKSSYITDVTPKIILFGIATALPQRYYFRFHSLRSRFSLL